MNSCNINSIKETFSFQSTDTSIASFEAQKPRPSLRGCCCSTLSCAPHPVLSQIHSHNIFRLHAKIKCPNHDISWRSSAGILFWRLLKKKKKNQTHPQPRCATDPGKDKWDYKGFSSLEIYQSHLGKLHSKIILSRPAVTRGRVDQDSKPVPA